MLRYSTSLLNITADSTIDSIIFALNAVAPIVLLIAVGYLLKRVGLINRDFIKTSNNLVFRIFLPAMLFLNVYNIVDIGNVDLGYCLYTVVVVLLIFMISLFTVPAITADSPRRGALLQASFRSNYALVGIPLAGSLFGSEGVAVASVLSAATIPVFNLLAVVSLSIYGEKSGVSTAIKRVLLGIVKNPLIQSVLVGVMALFIRSIFTECGVGWRLSEITPLFKLLEYLSSVATPLALIALGAGFEFSTTSNLRREVIFGTVARTAIVPLVGIGSAAVLFKDNFGGAEFASIVAVFATPVAVSSVPMAQEMGADTDLAGQLVVWTTMLSAITIFIASFILKQLGIF